MPLLASNSARCGPTPLIIWTLVAKVRGGIRRGAAAVDMVAHSFYFYSPPSEKRPPPGREQTTGGIVSYFERRAVLRRRDVQTPRSGKRSRLQDASRNDRGRIAYGVRQMEAWYRVAAGARKFQGPDYVATFAARADSGGGIG